MKVFTNLNELIKRLYVERKLLHALFQVHMKFDFRYEEALRVLEPILIIRYGDKIPGEREDISVYFENINLKNLRNGRKRISC